MCIFCMFSVYEATSVRLLKAITCTYRKWIACFFFLCAKSMSLHDFLAEYTSRWMHWGNHFYSHMESLWGKVENSACRRYTYCVHTIIFPTKSVHRTVTVRNTSYDEFEISSVPSHTTVLFTYTSASHLICEWVTACSIMWSFISGLFSEYGVWTILCDMWQQGFPHLLFVWEMRAWDKLKYMDKIHYLLKLVRECVSPSPVQCFVCLASFFFK